MSDSQVQLSKHENKKIAKEFVTTSLLLAVTKKYNKKLHTTNSYIKKWNNVLIEHGKQQKKCEIEKLYKSIDFFV